MVNEVNDKNFDDEVIKSSMPVMVDLWAPWCGPCRMVAPVVEKLSNEYNGKVKFCKLNIVDNPLTPANYKVRSIPTLLFFKDGKLTTSVTGAVPERALKPKLDSLAQSK